MRQRLGAGCGGSHPELGHRSLSTRGSDKAGDGGRAVPEGPQRVTRDTPRLWILPCITPRKQKSLSGKHEGELSRKKDLEVSRNSVPECGCLGTGAACSWSPPFPSPSSVSEWHWPVAPGSPTWTVESGRGRAWDLIQGVAPSFHPEHSQMFGICFLPDLRRCLEDRESPSSP